MRGPMKTGASNGKFRGSQSEWPRRLKRDLRKLTEKCEKTEACAVSFLSLFVLIRLRDSLTRLPWDFSVKTISHKIWCDHLYAIGKYLTIHWLDIIQHTPAIADWMHNNTHDLNSAVSWHIHITMTMYLRNMSAEANTRVNIYKYIHNTYWYRNRVVKQHMNACNTLNKYIWQYAVDRR